MICYGKPTVRFSYVHMGQFQLERYILREFCPIEMSKDSCLSLFLFNQSFPIKNANPNLETIVTNVRPDVSDWKNEKEVDLLRLEGRWR